MTVLTPSVEEIVEKLVRIAWGNPALVQEALSRASAKSDEPPDLEQVVDYIVKNRKSTSEPAA